MRLTAPKLGVALLAAVAAGACADFDVPNLNQPAVEDLTSDPTRAAITQAAIGLLFQTRISAASNARTFGHWGREGYSLNVPQGGIGSIISGPFAPGSTRGEWGGPYRNLRTAYVLLDALDASTNLTAAEAEALRGFTKTVMAYDFMHLITHKEPWGVPIDVNRDPTGDPAAPVPAAQVYAHMATLLDEARGHLQAGGSAFPMALPAGLADFNTPAKFVLLNRAIRARAAVYAKTYAAALTALGESFLDTGKPLTFGAYHNFASGTGDATNGLFAPQFHYADTTFRTRAQLKANGDPDDRFTTKTVKVTELSLSGLTTDLQFTMYASTGAPLPWVKNEELILLRAEANLGAGNVDAALTDINFIRQNAGGLAPIALADWQGRTSIQQVQELLYNKRFSLPWEYGHSWIDHMHWGRLLDLKNHAPGPPHNHNFFVGAPYPAEECEAQPTMPAACTTVTGLI